MTSKALNSVIDAAKKISESTGANTSRMTIAMASSEAAELFINDVNNGYKSSKAESYPKHKVVTIPGIATLTLRKGDGIIKINFDESKTASKKASEK